MAPALVVNILASGSGPQRQPAAYSMQIIHPSAKAKLTDMLTGH